MIKPYKLCVSILFRDAYITAAASAAMEFDRTSCETVNDATVRHLQHIYEVDRKCLIDEAKYVSSYNAERESISNTVIGCLHFGARIKRHRRPFEIKKFGITGAKLKRSLLMRPKYVSFI